MYKNVEGEGQLLKKGQQVKKYKANMHVSDKSPDAQCIVSALWVKLLHVI